MKSDLEELLRTTKPTIGQLVTPQPSGEPEQPAATSKLLRFILIGIAAVIVISGGIFAFLRFSAHAPQPDQTPGPTPASARLTPPAPFFAVESSRTISVEGADRPLFFRLLQDSLQELEREKTVKRIVVKIRETTGERFATPADFLRFLSATPPPLFLNQLDRTLMLFVFYEKSGPRIGFAAQTTDSGRTLSALFAWENTILSSLRPLFFNEELPGLTEEFIFEDRVYRNIDWRYLKLSQEKDLGVGYTIFPANNLLVVTMSKGLMETAINRLYDAQ